MLHMLQLGCEFCLRFEMESYYEVLDGFELALTFLPTQVLGFQACASMPDFLLLISFETRSQVSQADPKFALS